MNPYAIGQRVLVQRPGELFGRCVAKVVSGPEQASHARDASGTAPIVYRIRYDWNGRLEWQLATSLRAYAGDGCEPLRWADCSWQPQPELVDWLAPHIAQRAVMARAIARLKKELGDG